MRKVAPPERRPSPPKLAGRLVWLAYLALYFTPWLFRPPRPPELAAGLVGTTIFLAIYADGLRTRRSPMLHALASAGVGFALSPFGGAWSVFNVYGASFAARMRPRRRATVMLVGLQLALAAFGLATHQPWPAWVSGIFFGALIGFGVLWQSELEEKNRQLEQAQGEVRALATAAERERIARDLHDLLGHTLTLVAVKADLAQRLCDRDLDAARREMQELAAIARDALVEVRTAVVGMKGASLAAEVERAQRALSAAGVQVQVQVRNQVVDGDPQREAVITMALREAVTNVIRHAHARVCTIGVESTPDGEMKLSVTDDGRGGAVAEGFGLSGMRIRLEAAGGSLRVESGREGLQLTASLPAGAGRRA
ncbi:sensor histidine kinase [Caulobacter sp. S45]|uniref:sensor histidine kinase n=1 Tax=Caulobacter sp. S45 TaxID=1641861 RepID=UPI0020C72919|nr:sensor histidine kinase [Caulobacter sp. S45]